MEEEKYPFHEEESMMASEPAMARLHGADRQALTPTQLYLLKVFSRDNTEETAKEIQMLVFRYYQQKMDRELDELWDTHVLDQEKLEEYRSMHIRDVLK